MVAVTSVGPVLLPAAVLRLSFVAGVPRVVTRMLGARTVILVLPRVHSGVLLRLG
jgi:hypothetical protein